MAVTWNVVALDATKTIGSLSDVVTTVHWTASDTDGDHTGSSYGSIGLAEVTSIEAGIAAQITESKTPTTTTGVPWS